MSGAIVNSVAAGGTHASSRNPDALRLRISQMLGRRVDETNPELARQAGSRMAAELFFKPMLQEMRNFPLRGPLGDGGTGESVFAERLDERLADTIAAASPALVDRLAREFRAPHAEPSAAGVAARAREVLRQEPVLREVGVA